MANLVKWGTGVILTIIATTNYPGILLLMALESACVPVPSEIVMPFSGALSYGIPDYPKLNFWLVGMVGTIGCLLGSLVAYYVGSHVGRPVLLKYGKYLLLTPKHLERTEKFFERRGDLSIIVARLLPVIRTFISLPAGIARMDLRKFTVYTFVGSLPWCYALAYIGYWLGPKWESTIQFFHGFDLIIIAAIIILMIWYIWQIRNSTSK